jgi:thymidylate synthase ThyX
MNERIKQLADKIWKEEYWDNPNTDKLLPAQLNRFAELIAQECNRAVLEVPLYYKDYRSQIEEAVIRDCARAVLEKFGVDQ